MLEKNSISSQDSFSDVELQDNLTETSNLCFKLENFEGPLDLLVELVRKNKMDIENIELSKITAQYLEIISDIKKVDMDNASEFIEWAAILIEAKSKKLLPKLIDDEVEEDTEELIKLRILEYSLLKEGAEKLKLLESNDKFYKNPEKEANKFRIVIKDMQLDMLLDAFANIMHRIKKEESKNLTKEIHKEKFTVAQKISSVKDALIIREKIKFSELFGNSISREEIVTTFLALLELLKLQEIQIVQEALFSEIEISKKEPQEDLTE